MKLSDLYRAVLFGSILFAAVASWAQPSPISKVSGDPFPGTAKLDWDGDIVEKLIDATDKFFLAETLETARKQESFWARDLLARVTQKGF